VALALIDVAVGGDPAAIREFAQTAEEIGSGYVCARPRRRRQRREPPGLGRS
jgi:hypothetical protein